MLTSHLNLLVLPIKDTACSTEFSLYYVADPRREPRVAERVGGDNGLRRHDRHPVQQGAVRRKQVGPVASTT